MLFLSHTIGNLLRRVNSSHEYLSGCTQRVPQTVGKTAIFWTCFNRVHCTKFACIYGGMWIDARRWTQVARRRRAVEGSKGGAGAPPASAGHTARLLRKASSRVHGERSRSRVALTVTIQGSRYGKRVCFGCSHFGCSHFGTLYIVSKSILHTLRIECQKVACTL